MLSFDSKRSLMYNRDWLFQMPLLIAVSLAAGLLGAAFNLLRRGLWRVRASRKKPGLRILEVGSQLNLQQTQTVFRTFRIQCFYNSKSSSMVMHAVA